MPSEMKRREFIELTVAGGVLCGGLTSLRSLGAEAECDKLTSPGCRKGKVQGSPTLHGKSIKSRVGRNPIWTCSRR